MNRDDAPIRGAAIDPLTGLAVPAGLRLVHLQPTLGTEVHDIDLGRELDAEMAGFLRQLWLKRRVLFFRDQDISREAHIRLGRYFGELELMPTEPGEPPPEYPELLVLKRDGSNQGGSEAFFHQDVPYADPPAAGAVAMMRQCPPLGGDTVFADMVAAYVALPPPIKAMIEELSAEHRFDEGIRYYNRQISQDLVDGYMDKYPPKRHPVVQRHPETGEPILYVSLAYTSRILGLSQSESLALVRMLSERAHIPEHQCRFRWEQNSIAIWDNRAVQHYACFDYAGASRELHRVTILDAQPWPRQERTG